MAKDIRVPNPIDCVDVDKKSELIKECKRQFESCLFTSTSLYIWLKDARLTRRVFVVAPIILSAIATWSFLENIEAKWIAATCALLAGLFPAIFEALKLDAQLDEIALHAASFKNLQDRFRQAALVTSKEPYEKFIEEFNVLMKKMEEARASSITPPEYCFKAAQNKIKEGDYDFSVDEEKDLDKEK